jgi:hypothetical protein
MKDILDHDHPNKPLMKVKHILILFISVYILRIIGGFFKLESWPYASELLILGTAVLILSLIIALIKLLIIKDLNSFLNK